MGVSSSVQTSSRRYSSLPCLYPLGRLVAVDEADGYDEGVGTGTVYRWILVANLVRVKYKVTHLSPTTTLLDRQPHIGKTITAETISVSKVCISISHVGFYK